MVAIDDRSLRLKAPDLWSDIIVSRDLRQKENAADLTSCVLELEQRSYSRPGLGRIPPYLRSCKQITLTKWPCNRSP
jgi:hypothetical protein